MATTKCNIQAVASDTMSLPLATGTWDEEELGAIRRVVESDRYTMGSEVQSFELQFADFLGSKYCVMVNSGSSANLLAVASMIHAKGVNLNYGDEVIVPAVSWSTTFFPLHQYGLKLVFVDVDQTLNLDLDKVKDAISDRTRAIFAVNLLGNPIEYGRLKEIAIENDLIIFEDNCESLGAKLDGKQAGTFGLLGTFSTYFSHHISTIEGGMVVTDDEELYHVMLSLRSHGWTRHLPHENLLVEKSDVEFDESFRFILPGYNLRPVEFFGAVGQSQLRKLPGIVLGRRKNAQFFTERFSKIDGLTIQREVGSSSWFGFALILDRDGEREPLLSLLKDNGVETRPIVAGNFTRNPVIKLMQYEIRGKLEFSDKIHNNGFFIGNHHYDVTKELEIVAKITADYLEE
jgi:CDP-6-deoxy-D-xylo-4-hexulose-3-dehydrase